MAQRERNALVVPDRVDASLLRIGLEVEAFESVVAKKFWACTVVAIEKPHASPETWKVKVKFNGVGCIDDYETVDFDNLRPKGWMEVQKLKPRASKRARPDSALGQVEADTDVSDTDTVNNSADDNSIQQNAEQDAITGRNRRQRKKEDGTVVVTRIIDHRGEGDTREYRVLLHSGKEEWLPRSAFFEKEGTVTGALLAYEWTPAYIVQTYNNGEEYLVAWLNRTENDWARVPASAFTHRDVEFMRANRPIAYEVNKQRAIYRLFMGVQSCLRSTKVRACHFDHFPGVDIEAVLSGKGTPVTGDRVRYAGDQTLRSYSREELDPIFSPYRKRWDELRTSRGKLLGKIDFSESGAGVKIIWYARPYTCEFYYSADDERPFYEPERAPTPYVETVEVSIKVMESTPEEDLAVIQHDG